MKLRFLFLNCSLLLATSYAAADSACAPLYGSYKCTDVMSPTAFETSISSSSQNGSEIVNLTSPSREIKIDPTGIPLKQRDGKGITRIASGKCESKSLRIEEQITNSSTEAEYKVSTKLELNEKNQKIMTLKTETLFRAKRTDRWSGPSLELFICIRN